MPLLVTLSLMSNGEVFYHETNFNIARSMFAFELFFPKDSPDVSEKMGVTNYVSLITTPTRIYKLHAVHLLITLTEQTCK